MFHYDETNKTKKDIELQGTDKTGSGKVSLYENNGYYYYSHDKAGAGS